jgi:hypothetical protein
MYTPFSKQPVIAAIGVEKYPIDITAARIAFNDYLKKNSLSIIFDSRFILK